MFFKIKRWWKFTGRTIIRDLRLGFVNLITWFPIIWKDRNWDHWYILEILKQKLKKQSAYIKKRDLYTNALHDSKRMDLCVLLIDRIQEEYYLSEYYDCIDLEYSFESKNDSKSFSVKENVLKESYEDFFSKYPLIYKRVIQKESSTNKRSIARNISIINHIRAKKLLFKIIEQDMHKWWD